MELIKIEEKEGIQFISSLKDVYIGAGMDKSQWSRWIKSNIIKNSFFVENRDFETIDMMSSIDYRCTLGMAQHLVMQMRTEKAHEYRDYLIKCEKKLLEMSKPQNILRLVELTAGEMQKIDKKVIALELKFDTVLTLESHKQRIIQKAIAKRVYERVQPTCFQNPSYLHVKPEECDGYDDELEREVKSKLFSNIHRELKNKFGVTSYKDIKVVQYDDALLWIGNWIEDAGLLD